LLSAKDKLLREEGQLVLSYEQQWTNHFWHRGVARNLLRGDERGVLWDGSPPAGSRGRAPMGEARDKC